MNDMTKADNSYEIRTPNDPQRLRGNVIQSSMWDGIVARLNGLFQRALEMDDVVSPERLAEVLSDCEGETMAPPSSNSRTGSAEAGLEGLRADRLLRVAEGLSDESVKLLHQALEHLLRSETRAESDQPQSRIAD